MILLTWTYISYFESYTFDFHTYNVKKIKLIRFVPK